MSKLRVALVTGASSGIGRAIAIRLARFGFQVFGTSRFSSFRSVHDSEIQSLVLDVTDEQSVSSCVNEVLRSTGRIDILVNNAGIALIGGVEESTTAQAKAIFETNVFGVMRMTRAVLPSMRAQGTGRIISISSVFGFLPGPFSGFYAASKHALEGYSESLDHEVRRLGIRASLIEPGFTASSLDKNMHPPDAPLEAYVRSRIRIQDMFAREISSGPTPDTVAAVVLKAVTAKNPMVRYTAGPEAAMLRILRQFVPTLMFEKSFRKRFRLDI